MIDLSTGRLFATALSVLAAALLVTAGCNGAADCSADSDCFNGEECIDGRCAVEGGGNDVGDADSADDTTKTDVGEDVSTEDVSMDAEDAGEDASTEDAAPDVPDTSEEDVRDASTDGPACVVDKFEASCPDDFAEPNESSTTGYRLNDNSTIGCPTGDEFKPLSETHSTWLCANEEADWYSAIVYPCESTTFVIEARLTPATECNRDFYRAGASNFDCSDPDLSCSWDGETYVVQRFFDTGNSGVSYYFGIEKLTEGFGDDEALQLEYDVTFETRR